MKIGVVGCAGRMGQMLVRRIVATEGCELAGGTERPDGPAVGKDIGTLAGLDPVGVAITDDPLPVFAQVDGVLDFTTPASTQLALCRTFGAGPGGSRHRHDRSQPEPTRRRSRPPPVMPRSSRLRQHKPWRQPTGGARQQVAAALDRI